MDREGGRGLGDGRMDRRVAPQRSRSYGARHEGADREEAAAAAVVGEGEDAGKVLAASIYSFFLRESEVKAKMNSQASRTRLSPAIEGEAEEEEYKDEEEELSGEGHGDGEVADHSDRPAYRRLMLEKESLCQKVSKRGLIIFVQKFVLMEVYTVKV